MLIELDTHFHSVASTHAYSTVKEIAHSALENGIKGFAMTDHAPAMPDSPHIWHFRKYSERLRKCVLLWQVPAV